MDSKGFTFIEILLVLVLIGTIIGMSLPEIRSHFGYYALETTARTAAQFFRYAQYRAIADRTTTAVAVVAKKNQYRMMQSREQEGEEPKMTAVEGEWGRPVIVKPPIVIDAKSETVLYFPDGSSSGGGIVFKREELSARVGVRQGLGRLVIEMRFENAKE